MTSSGRRRLTKLLGPAIAVKHLVSVMRETGDSWEVTATTGVTQLWVPGGPKQESQNLGIDFPGKATRKQPTDWKGKAKQERRAKRQKAGTSTSEGTDEDE